MQLGVQAGQEPQVGRVAADRAAETGHQVFEDDASETGLPDQLFTVWPETALLVAVAQTVQQQIAKSQEALLRLLTVTGVAFKYRPAMRTAGRYPYDVARQRPLSPAATAVDNAADAVGQQLVHLLEPFQYGRLLHNGLLEDPTSDDIYLIVLRLSHSVSPTYMVAAVCLMTPLTIH